MYLVAHVVEDTSRARGAVWPVAALAAGVFAAFPVYVVCFVEDGEVLVACGAARCAAWVGEGCCEGGAKEEKGGGVVEVHGDFG